MACLLGLYLASGSSSLLRYPLLLGLSFAVVLLICLPLVKQCRISLLLLASFFYAFFVLLGVCIGKNECSLAFEHHHIRTIEGRLVEDSVLSQSGKQVLRMKLEQCSTVEGYCGSAKGITSALFSVDELFVSGSTLFLRGVFNEDGSLFFADELQVLHISRLGLLRRTILGSIKRRMEKIIEEPNQRSLALMLLLGQSTDEAFLFKNQSIACGCAHTLALSGMHLQIFLSLSSGFWMRIVGKAWGRRLGCIAPLIYVILIGPKPSLIRAMGMHLFSHLPFSRELGGMFSFWATCIFQLLFFPHSLSSYAFLYSWAAYGAIMLSSLVPKIPFRCTAFAILGTAPASLILSGSWNLAGLVWSFMISALIHAALLLSLGCLCMIPYCIEAFSLVVRMLSTLFMYGSEHPLHFQLLGYGVYFLVLLTSFSAILYAKDVLRKRRREQYELDICLRFTRSNHRIVGERGSFHDQEVWTEFPIV